MTEPARLAASLESSWAAACEEQRIGDCNRRWTRVKARMREARTEPQARNRWHNRDSGYYLREAESL